MKTCNISTVELYHLKSFSDVVDNSNFSSELELQNLNFDTATCRAHKVYILEKCAVSEGKHVIFE